MKNFELAKKICKEHGIKGFRKLNLKRHMYIAGKQCQSINPHVAKRLIDKLLSNGFEIRDSATCYELAEKGLLDTVTVC